MGPCRPPAALTRPLGALPPHHDPAELFRYIRRDALDQRFYCTLCPSFSHASRNNTRNHVESRHFPNTFHYPCDLCEATFTTKSTWAMHKSKKHNAKKQYDEQILNM